MAFSDNRIDRLRLLVRLRSVCRLIAEECCAFSSDSGTKCNLCRCLPLVVTTCLYCYLISCWCGLKFVLLLFALCCTVVVLLSLLLFSLQMCRLIILADFLITQYTCKETTRLVHSYGLPPPPTFCVRWFLLRSVI